MRALCCCRRLSMLGRRHQPQQFQVHLRTHWQQHAFSWQQIPMPAFRRRGPCRQHPQCKRLPTGPGKSRDSHSLFGPRRSGALALEARVCTRSTGIAVLHAWLSRERFSLFLTATQRRLGARTAAPYCLPVSAPPLPSHCHATRSFRMLCPIDRVFAILESEPLRRASTYSQRSLQANTLCQ